MVMRKTYLGTILISLSLLTACGGDETPSASNFVDNGLKPNVQEPFAFTLPSETSIKITLHGDGLDPKSYATVENFDLDEANGKWQIWLAHAVWSNNGGTRYSARNRSVSETLKSIERIRSENNLDFEINFLQVDRISRNLGMKQSSHTKNLSLSPIGDNGCGTFWYRCANRYVVSPFSRNPEDGMVTQREWLMPVIAPVIEQIHKDGPARNIYPLADSGILDPDSNFWDRIHLLAFIVNPEGEVVDAIVPQASPGRVSASAVMSRFILAANIDPKTIRAPEPDEVLKFDTRDIRAVPPYAFFGGDYTEIAMDNLSEMLE